MPSTRFLCALLFCYLFSSCTVSKIAWYFRPNIDDHTGVFICDTIRGGGTNPMETASVGKATANLEQSSWVTYQQALPSLDQWVYPEKRQGIESIETFLKQQKTTAFLVLRNDSLLYEQYFNGGSKEQARIVFSVTKSITATLTAIAIEEGVMRLDQPISDFLPAFAEKKRGDLQVKHLLNMVSGLDWGDFKDLWLLGHLYYTSNQERFVIKNSRYKYPVGTHFAYQSLATEILGVCLEKAIQQPMAQYMTSKLWQPVGMTYNAYLTLDNKKRRNPRTFGGMALTATDMVRFGQLMMHRGTWNGQQVVPMWFIEQLETRDLSRWFGYMNSYWRNGYEEADYSENHTYCAAGYKGQYIYVDPKEKMVVVRMGVGDDKSWGHMMGRLVGVMTRGENDITNPALDYSDDFAGTYYNEKGDSVYLTALPTLPNETKRWRWKHDLPAYIGRKQLQILTQFDGVSVGFRKKDQQTRLYYDVKDKNVVGFYYNSWPQTTLEYYKKMR
ncbi:MAG: serine hydrolase domain-containing protein [Aureispira sp.]